MVWELFSKQIQDIVKERFGNPTPIQQKAIPAILEGKNTLIIASTGSGKTETALLPLFNKLLTEENNPVSILYITPLRALNRNMEDRVIWWGNKLDIDIAIRHGDTTQYERSKQAENPADLMIITPETLQSIVVGKVMREGLRNVKWVVVDEVHEIVDSKRGVQLSVALERLRELTGKDIQIIGLSATVGSPEEVAKFLTGGRPCEIIADNISKKLKISVETPEIKPEDTELAEKSYVALPIASRMRVMWNLIKNKNSVLIFTNTRESAEILSSRLKIFNKDIEAHHSSLSKNVRVDTEKRFREKQLSHLVCTSSLELGIDIGSIDFILQYMSPRQTSKLLQRVGRSGHSLEKVSEGAIVCGDTDDCFESAAIAKLALEGNVEKTQSYGKSLDVLGHQLVGLTLEGDIGFEKAYSIIKRAYPFKNLTADEFWEVCLFMQKLGFVFLSGNETINSAEISSPKPTDRKDIIIHRRKKAWEYYYGNVSTIPDTKTFQIFDIIANQPVGSLDAEFIAMHGTPQTEFICKGQPWKILEIRGDRIYVEPANKIEAAIPAWQGELIPVSAEVAQEVGKLRKDIAEKIIAGEKEDAIKKWIAENYPVAEKTADIIFDSIGKQVAYLKKNVGKTGVGGLFSGKNILAEFSEANGNYKLIIHSCIGSLANETIGRAVASLLTPSLGSIGLKTDPYRIIFTLSTNNWKAVTGLLESLTPKQLETAIITESANTELFSWRFIHVAKRFGIISRGADYTKAYIRKIAEVYRNTPVYREALNEILEDKVDVKGGVNFLEKIKNGESKITMLQGLSPIGALGLEDKYEIIPSTRPEKEIFEMFKQRLENTEVGLVCCQCGKWSAVYHVKNLPKAIICPLCAARLVGIVPAKYADSARKLVKKNSEGKKILPHEKKWLNLTLDSGSLVITYGNVAATVMAGRGIGVATAKRVLAKIGTGKTASDNLLKEVLEAEKLYAKNKRFWK